jgi:hypothetical protein
MLTGSTLFPIAFDESGNIVFYQTLEDAKAQKFDPLFDMKLF